VISQIFSLSNNFFGNLQENNQVNCEITKNFNTEITKVYAKREKRGHKEISLHSM